MIYTITVVKRIDKKRCIGFFNNKPEAYSAVRENLGDMYENGYYPYAVIEAVPQGLYSYDINPIWFKWDGMEYKMIKQPVRFKKILGFGIG